MPTQRAINIFHMFTGESDLSYDGLGHDETKTSDHGFFCQNDWCSRYDREEDMSTIADSAFQLQTLSSLDDLAYGCSPCTYG
jgi:hypothetical protein